jgi:hypothetical protein
MATTTQDRISPHEVRVYEAVRDAGAAGVSAGEIAARSPGFAKRTIRSHLTEMVRRGAVERCDVFPSPLYRLNPNAEDKCPAYLARLREAAERFGQAAH